MRKTTRMIVLAAGFALVGSSTALAQGSSDSKVFVDVNVGIETRAKAFDTNATFLLFGETAAVATRQQPGTSLMADVRIGYRGWSRFGVALAVSGARNESVGQVTASVPSAIRFSSPSLLNLEAPGLIRREIAYHLQAVWFPQVSDKVTVAVYGGPSLIRLQRAVPSLSIAGATTTVTSANETGFAKGGHAGIDLTYPLSKRYGVGVFARYAVGSVDLPSESGVKVSGLQAGGGLRLRF